QLAVGVSWSLLSDLPPPLGTLFLLHFAATPTCLALLKRTALHADLVRAPILGPTLAVGAVLVGCAGLGLLHDALEAGILGRMPWWSGILVFLVAVFLSALLGAAIQGERPVAPVANL